MSNDDDNNNNNSIGGSDVIKSYKLTGHREGKSVLCLDYCCSSCPSSSSSLLLSGSDDRTARVFDLREDNSSSRLRAAMCIKTTGDVLSVAFGPRWIDDDDDAVESSLRQQFGRDAYAYLSVDSYVYGYDLRIATGPILTRPTVDLSPVLQSQDEVNQIAFSCPSSKWPCCGPIYAAAADDAGAVRVATVPSTTIRDSRNRKHQVTTTRVLSHGSGKDDSCMVATAAFRPQLYIKKKTTAAALPQPFSSPPCWLASGGTDCAVRLWDVAKPRKPVAEFAIGPSQAGANQICNPPMVNHLAWSPSGRLLAAALGDGSVALFSSVEEKKSSPLLAFKTRLEEAHSGPVACVAFPQWGPSQVANEGGRAGGSGNRKKKKGKASSSLSSTAHDRLLLTAGNDGTLLLFDLGRNLCGDRAVDPRSYLPPVPQQHQKPQSEGTFGDNVGTANHQACDDDDNDDEQAAEAGITSSMERMAVADNDDNDDGNPKTLFGWHHGKKPNWIVCNNNGGGSSGGGERINSVFSSSPTVFVADTSNEITAYVLPVG